MTTSSLRNLAEAIGVAARFMTPFKGSLFSTKDAFMRCLSNEVYFSATPDLEAADRYWEAGKGLQGVVWNATELRRFE